MEVWIDLKDTKLPISPMLSPHLKEQELGSKYMHFIQSISVYELERLQEMEIIRDSHERVCLDFDYNNHMLSLKLRMSLIQKYSWAQTVWLSG